MFKFIKSKAFTWVELPRHDRIDNKSKLKKLKKLVFLRAKNFRDLWNNFSNNKYADKFRSFAQSFSEWENFLDFHYAIGASRNILLKILVGVEIPFFKEPPCLDLYNEHGSNIEIRQEKHDPAVGVKERKKIYAPRRYFHNISPVFYLDQNDKVREIFNATVINAYTPRYKTSLPSLLKWLNQKKWGDIDHKMDLTDAYNQIKMATTSLKHLGVNVGDIKSILQGKAEVWGYRSLPFGLRVAVFIFIKMSIIP